MIGGTRAQGVLAHSRLGTVAQSGDVLVGQQGRPLIAALQREHARRPIERIGACELAIRQGGGGQPEASERQTATRLAHKHGFASLFMTADQGTCLATGF